MIELYAVKITIKNFCSCLFFSTCFNTISNHLTHIFSPKVSYFNSFCSSGGSLKNMAFSDMVDETKCISQNG